MAVVPSPRYLLAPESVRNWRSNAISCSRLRHRERFINSVYPYLERQSAGERFEIDRYEKPLFNFWCVIMPKYVIEREIPGAGKLSPNELQGISAKSCGVLQQLGPAIQWVQSYITDDKVYCVYIAPNEAMVREHAAKGGFPANKVSEVREIIDPTTAERAS
jgi:hypothetical protein